MKLYAFHPCYNVEEMVGFIFSSTNVSTLSTPGGADMRKQFLFSPFLQKAKRVLSD